MKSKKKFYAIVNGYKTGIYYGLWDNCKAFVEGYPGCIYKGFKTKSEADQFMQKNKAKIRCIESSEKEDISEISEKNGKEQSANNENGNSEYVCKIENTEKMQFRGKIKRILFKNESWSSVVMDLYENGKKVDEAKVTGIVDPIENTFYDFEATKTVHPKFGEQLNVTKCIPDIDDAELFASFMSEYIKGIGPVLANNIYSTFKDNLFEVLDTNPELLLQVPKMTKKKIDKVVSYYKENYQHILISHELYRFTEGKITPNQCKKIIDRYKDNTMSVIKQNPYILTEVDGFGFKTADDIALSAGIKIDDKNRIKAVILYILDEAANKEGHTYLYSNELEKSIMELIHPIPKEHKKKMEVFLFHKNKGDDVEPLLKGLPKNEQDLFMSFADQYERYLTLITDCLMEMYQEDGSIIIYTKDVKVRIYTARLYKKEEACAFYIDEIFKKKPNVKKINTAKIHRNLKKFEKANGYTFDDEQLAAVFRSLKSRISVITGGAGRGKTSIIKMIISGWTGDIVLCAPTGRAALRMSEATDLEAATIHRTIYDYVNNDKKDLPEGCLVIVDEASMINLTLGHDILERVYASNSHVIFVGDANQLPPIGAGDFFSQLVSSNIYISRLEKAYRQMGSINENADLVNKGKQANNFIIDDKFKFCQLKAEDTVKEKIERIWKYARKHYDVSDIRILSPMKNKGLSCVNTINDIIREIENPKTNENNIPESSLRIGDRVIQQANDYKMLFKIDGKFAEAPLFNGEVGTIVRVETYDEDDYAVIALDLGNEVYYPLSKINELNLAYATTVHKAQGSEFKCVIMLTTNEHFVMLKRNLLYTGLTRAKEEMIFINEGNSVNKAILDSSYNEIHCSLREKITADKSHNIKR